MKAEEKTMNSEENQGNARKRKLGKATKQGRATKAKKSYEKYWKVLESIERKGNPRNCEKQRKK